MTREEIGKMAFDALRKHCEGYQFQPTPWEDQGGTTQGESIAIGLAVYRAALERAAEACEARATCEGIAQACSEDIRAMIAELDDG